MEVEASLGTGLTQTRQSCAGSFAGMCNIGRRDRHGASGDHSTLRKVELFVRDLMSIQVRALCTYNGSQEDCYWLARQIDRLRPTPILSKMV